MEKQLRDAFFQSAGDAFFLADADTGIIIDANRRAEDLTGYDRAELIQMHQSQLHPQQMSDHYRAVFARHASGDQHFAANIQVLRKDGAVATVEVQSSTFEYEGRKLLLGIFRDTTERELLTRRMELSEKRNRAIVEFTPTSIVVHSEGRIVFANESALNVVGADSPSDLLGQSVLQFVHPDDLPAVQQRIGQMMSEKNTVPIMEERLRRLNGDFFSAEVHATAIEWDGKLSVMVAFQDITERMLRRNHRESMLQLLQKALRLTDTQAILDDLVKIHSKRLKADILALVLKDETSLTAPSDGNLSSQLKKALESTPLPDDAIYITDLRSDDVPHLLRKAMVDEGLQSCWALTVRDQPGKSRGTLAVFSRTIRYPDDEEKEILQQASYLVSVFLHRSELLDENYRLALVARQTRESVVLTDVERNVTWVNDAFTKVTGFSSDDVRGKNLKSILQGPATNPATAQFMKERLEQVKGFDCRIFNYRKTGEGFWNDLRIDPVFDRLGKHIGFVGLQTDVTEEMEGKERLEHALDEAGEASRARSDFLSIVSHEIRTPLNSISGIVHLLSDREPREDQIEEIDILKKSAERLQILVGDILDFGQIDSGRLSFQNQPFSLKSVIHDLCESFVPSFTHTPVTFEYSIDEQIPDSLSGDPTRIRQIFFHLLNNAQKFTTSGHIKLKVAEAGHIGRHVEIEAVLTDTGIGMNSSVLSRIFEPFYKGDSSLTRRHSGTGLGLAIAQRILDYYGGDIEVESDPGKGSTFRFYFKLERTSESLNTLVQSLTHFADFRVLIVEDYEANILITRKFLELWNVKVDQAYNGEEALHKVKNHQYDLILMDLHMPVMDGYEATRRIRIFNSAIPIIALTASAQSDVQEKIKEAGMNDLIVKPFHPAELNRKISNYQKSRPRDELTDA